MSFKKKILLLALLFIFPIQVQAQLKNAYESLVAKNYNNALSFASASNLNPNPHLKDYELWTLGKSYFEKTQWNEAKIPLKTLAQNYPQTIFFQRAVGHYFLTLLQTQAYSEILSQAPKFLNQVNDENRADILWSLSQAQIKDNKSNLAILSLKEIYLNFPGYTQIVEVEKILQNLNSFSFSDAELLKRAQKAFEIKRYTLCLQILAPLQNKNIQAQILAGRANYENKAYSQAIVLLDAVRNLKNQDEQSAEAWLDLGLSYEKSNLSSLALVTYESQIKTLPQFSATSEAFLQRVKLSLENNSYLTLLSQSQQSAALLFKNASLDKALWILAWRIYEDKQYAQASQAFALLKNFASDFPSQAKGAYWEARSFEKVGDLAKAKALFAKSYDLAPLSYYGLFAFKKLKNQNDLHSLPAEAKELKKYLNTKTIDNFPHLKLAQDHIHKMETLVESGMGKFVNAEMQFFIKTHASEPEILKAFLKAAKQSKYAYIRVFVAQRYWDYFKILFLNSKEAELEKNLLQATWPYKKEIEQTASDLHLSPYLIVGLMRQESAFQSWVISSANAQGLMQLLPTTAQIRAKSIGQSGPIDLLKPTINIRLGSAELKALLDRFSNNLPNAIAGYNAGPGRPPQWRQKFSTLEEDEFIEEIPFSETNLYVKLVLRNYWVYLALYS